MPASTGGNVNVNVNVKVNAWFVVAAAAVLGGATTLLALGTTVANLAGYVGASAGVVALVALHRNAEMRLRNRTEWFVARPGLHRLGTAVLVGGLVVASIHAWYLAAEWSR